MLRAAAYVIFAELGTISLAKVRVIAVELTTTEFAVSFKVVSIRTLNG